MKDALRTGAYAGFLTGLVASSVEIAFALRERSAVEVPLYGYLLMPVFYLVLLVPIGGALGALAGAWFWCWHGRDGDSLRERARALVGGLEAGSLNALGWFWGVSATAGCVAVTGGFLFASFSGAFHDMLLAGALLAVVLAAFALFLGVVIRRALFAAGAGIRALKRRRVGRFLGGVQLAAASALAVVAGIAVAVVRHRIALEDVGLDLLCWSLGLPLGFGAAFALVVATLPRWRRRAVSIAAIAILVAGPAAAAGLGEIEAVRGAALFEDTPSAFVVSALSDLSDFDGDGASALFGGGDCAPFDSKIYPGAIEIPGNGVDDNCMGGDASAGAQDLRNPKAFAKLPDGFPVRPNLVLITVDAERADHMSLYGYRRRTTPNLDRHAKGGVVFERAYSQGTGTISSMPSLMTSKYSYQVSYVDDEMPPAIDPRETLLAEHLKRAGYATFSVTPLGYANSGRWGLLQGLDVTDQTASAPQPNDNTTSPKIFAGAQELLKKARKGKRPFFLWVHFYDPHAKYLAHEGQKAFGGSQPDKYDGEILFTDGYVGQLLDLLRAPGNPPTVIVFGADHGDGFKEDRGKSNHAYGLYDELLHVPLVVWAPGAAPRRVDTPVGNVDIAATLVNAAGLSKPYLRGDSLVPYVYGGYRDPDRLVFSEKTFGRGAGKRYQKSVTGMRWRMVRWVNERREFLFDLRGDPKEKRNVLAEHPDVAAALRRQIDLFMERNAIDTLELE
jgi:choline-sulfatase